MIKFKNYFRYILIWPILRFKNFDSSESIIIFGEARSGTTWLLEMISAIIPSCINWEPLHVTRGVVPKKYKFGWRPFLPVDDTSEIYKSLFVKTLNFDVYSLFTTSYIKVRDLFHHKPMLIKFVRANLLVPYLLKNFNFNHPPIFLLRNPIDTCISQINTWDKFKIKGVNYEIPDCINNERFAEHHNFLMQLESELERKIANWCINNCQTINQLNELKVNVVYYSDLLINPKKELKDILDSIGLDYDKSKLDSIDFRKASSTDFIKSYSASVEKQLNKNFEILDTETKDKIQKIFDHFELKLYTAYSPLPVKKYRAMYKLRIE